MAELAGEDFPTMFYDELRREWTVKLSVPIVHKFAVRHRIGVAAFQPHLLTLDQLLELAYDGTRYQARAQAGESFEEFLNALEGPSFLKAQEAAAHAALNFFLRIQPKEIVAECRKNLGDVIAGMKAMYGLGGTSSNSAPSPESTPTPPI